MTEKTISFKQEFIPNIIAGVQTQTRRLKKEGECAYYPAKNVKETVLKDSYYCVHHSDETHSLKFQVGEVYQVVVDKKPVWYCPKCKTRCHSPGTLTEICWNCRIISQPLKIKVLSIKEQKLCDITIPEAKKEGYRTKIRFLFEFAGDYVDKIPKKFKNSKKQQEKTGTNWIRLEQIKAWNPSVWALRFKKVNKK